MDETGKSTVKGDIGVVGLGVMGRSLAYNIAGRGYRVLGSDIKEGVAALAEESAGTLPFTGCPGLAAFYGGLSRPRRVIVMVPAGEPTDKAIRNLLPYLEKGDIIMDAGNSFYRDTIRRETALIGRGILFLGTGVSGGETGARYGPSIMAGGDPAAYEAFREVLEAIAARTPSNDICCACMGRGGAGHFVKMVHNGIEYIDMQLIAESYFLLRHVLGLEPDRIADVFEKWNRGELSSYLIEITVKVLRRREPDGSPLIDAVLDEAGQKGTGIWAAQEALSLGVAAPTLAGAVFARAQSVPKADRLKASLILKDVTHPFKKGDGFVEAIERALYASKIIAYAQGFELLRSASEEFSWGLDLSAAAAVWRGGCIIRAAFLDHIMAFYHANPHGGNLLLDSYFAGGVAMGLADCRAIVSQAALSGTPLPCFSSALGYYDSMRSPLLPANLIQLQRDFFGAHTYKRLDRKGSFHTDWSESGL